MDEAAVGALAGERGELVARERDLLLDLRDALARRRDRCLGLLQLDLGVEARSEALPREVEDRLALVERRPREVELVEGVAELRVSVCDGGGEQQPRRKGVHLGGARLAERGVVRGAVLAPEVDLVAELERELALRVPARRRSGAGKCRWPSSAAG